MMEAADLQTQDSAVISNEQIVEIAFGIVLDRIRRRKAPRDALNLVSASRCCAARDITSRCVRTFTYKCNEASSSTSASPRSSVVQEKEAAHCDTQRSPLTSATADMPQAKAAAAAAAAAAASRKMGAATSLTPHPQGDGSCYCMRSDARSRDTVMACHSSASGSAAATEQQRQRRRLNLQVQQPEPDKDIASRDDSKSQGSGSAATGATDGCTFRVKIDHQQLSRALGSLSATELPAELLVDVNCCTNCRVSEVSLKQGQGKQCVLSLRVDSGSSGADGGGGGSGPVTPATTSAETSTTLATATTAAAATATVVDRGDDGGAAAAPKDGQADNSKFS